MGQRRIESHLVLKGGGSVREEIVRVDEPHSFGVAMSHLTGPLSALAARIDSEFLFARGDRHEDHVAGTFFTPVLP